MSLRTWVARMGADLAFLCARLLSGVGAYVMLAVGLAAGMAIAVAVGAVGFFVVPVIAGVLALALALALIAGRFSSRVRIWLSRRPFRRMVRSVLAPIGRGLVTATGWWLLRCRAVARRERARIAAHRAAEIPIAYRPLPDGRRAVVRVMAADPATWRDLVYLVVSPVYAVVACIALVALVIWVIGLLLSAPGFRAPDVSWWADPTTWATIAAAVGLLAVTPVAVLGFARGASALGAALLSTGESARMRAELDEQRLRRQLAVDAAERERRKIERDLHDGAQQRLVALGMSLGLARETLPTDPVAGAALVAEAHSEAKLALVELRDLARGIHPAILGDRGLDAALSELLRRTKVPVSMLVALPSRPPTAVESAAYFVVAEALTNISRHACASRATVEVREAGAFVQIEVTDDGVGGADPTAGTGLAGLADRVGALGGRLTVASPTGGPTTIRAEIPCGS